MSLCAALQARWASGGLAGWVPPERVVTGLALAPREVPYVTLQQGGEEQITRTSGARLRQTPIRFAVWHGDYDAARALAREIERGFERCEFTWGEARILDARVSGVEERPRDDGMWQITVALMVTWESSETG